MFSRNPSLLNLAQLAISKLIYLHVEHEFILKLLYGILIVFLLYSCYGCHGFVVTLNLTLVLHNVEMQWVQLYWPKILFGLFTLPNSNWQVDVFTSKTTNSGWSCTIIKSWSCIVRVFVPQLLIKVHFALSWHLQSCFESLLSVWLWTMLSFWWLWCTNTQWAISTTWSTLA